MSEAFAADAVRYTGSSDGTRYSGLAGGSAALGVRYDAATGRYTLAAPDGAEVALASSASTNRLYDTFSITDTAANQIRLLRVGSGSLGGTRYVSGGTWLRQSGPPTALSTNAQAFTFGVRTPVADVPRTGSGNFGVVLTALNGASGGGSLINGSGVLVADFGASRWSVTGTSLSRSLTSPGASSPIVPSVFSGNGNLVSGVTLDGKLSLGFPGNTLNELVSGRFYGPGATEIGLTFGDRSLASDQFVAGTLIGTRGATAPVIETLSSLLAPGSVPFDQYSLRVNTDGSTLGLPPSVEFNGGITSRVGLDPVAQTLEFSSGFPLGPGNRVAAESDARFSVYRQTGGQTPLTYRIYNPGVGNTELALDFVSFALADQFGRSAVPYGLRSSSEYVPLSGRATFDGVFHGDALSANSTNLYDLRGLASLTADFGALTLSGSFTANATFQGTTTSLGTFTLANGRIGQFDQSNPLARPANLFNADITGAPGTLGALNGSFYGPAVQELGGTVRLVTPGPTGVTLLGQGVIVAKRGPIDGTPAPTPPPAAPPPANSSLDPLTVSDTFAANARRASAVNPGNGTSPTDARAVPLTVRYDAATQSYTVEEGGASATFAPGSRVTSTRLADLFQVATTGGADTLRLTPTGTRGAAGTRYVAGGIWTRDVTANAIRSLAIRSFVFGMPTASADIPTTGTASFGVVLNGVQPVGTTPSVTTPTLATINGSAVMTVDWTTRQVTADGVIYSRSPLGGNGPALLVPGGFQYRGNAVPTGVRGFITLLDSSGNPGASGEANGFLYGTGASEIGIAYNTTSGTPIRSGVGTIVGTRGASAPAFETLTSLSSEVSLSGFVGRVLIPAAGQGTPAEAPSARPGNATIGLAANTYNILGPVGPGDVVAAESGTRFTTFRTTNSSGTTTTRVYRAGSGNTELALSYASIALADFVSPSASNIRASNHFVFGLPTLASTLPRTGTGSFAGVVYGSGYVPSALNDAYALTGTTALTFDWAAATFGGAMTLAARNERTGVSEAMSAINFAGGALNRSTGGFTSTLSGATGVSGDMLGSFFGPIGQELGAAFRLNAPVAAGPMQAQGVLVGKQN